jgi:hypothetical protein
MGCCGGRGSMTPLQHDATTLGAFLEDLGPVTCVCRCGGRSQEIYYELSMDEYGYSTGQPLFTVGAGPCLIVVIHETRRKVGCLAHVHDQLSLLPAVLAWVMLKSVEAMMATIGTTDVNVYLAAGGSFGPPNPRFVTHPPVLPFKYSINFGTLFRTGRVVPYDAPYDRVDFSACCKPSWRIGTASTRTTSSMKGPASEERIRSVTSSIGRSTPACC